MLKSVRSGAIDQMIVGLIPQLRSYARALTHDKDRADDLLQDCLQRALERLHQWEPGSNMRAWLFTIMHNLHASYAKRFNNGPQFINMDQPIDSISRNVDCVNAEEPSSQLQDLEQALSQLSAEHREIIHLVCVEDMKYEEVARILNIAVGTVMSRLYRAREQLRTLMYGDDKGDSSPGLRRVK